MRKIIFIFVLFLFSFSSLYATDACVKLVPREESFVWEVIFASNLRTYPCTYKSSVIWVSKSWETLKIISSVDWWYKIELDNWSFAWIWDQSIKKTNLSLDIKLKSYELSIKDKRLVYTINQKIKKLVSKKWKNYKKSILTKLKSTKLNKKLSDRKKAILDKLIVSTESIKINKKIIEKKNIENKEVIKKDSNIISNSDLENIDYEKVKSTWLWRYNSLRNDLWKKSYTYDDKLEKTAFLWSDISKNRWYMDHRRDKNDSYYNYNKINNWFKDNWVVCKNIYRVTHSENIWWGFYSCSDSDCTDELISSIRSTYDFYFSEKDMDYKPHYNSMVNDYFTKIWLGISIDKQRKDYFKYYLTVHYCTDLQ